MHILGESVTAEISDSGGLLRDDLRCVGAATEAVAAATGAVTAATRAVTATLARLVRQDSCAGPL